MPQLYFYLLLTLDCVRKPSKLGDLWGSRGAIFMGGSGARSDVVMADIFLDSPWLKFWVFFLFLFWWKPWFTTVSGQFWQWNVTHNCCRLFHMSSCFKFVVGELQMWSQFFIPPVSIPFATWLQVFPSIGWIYLSSPGSGLDSCYALANGMQPIWWCVSFEFGTQRLSAHPH